MGKRIKGFKDEGKDFFLKKKYNLAKKLKGDKIKQKYRGKVI